MTTETIEQPKVEEARKSLVALEDELKEIHSKLEKINGRRPEIEEDLPAMKDDVAKKDADHQAAFDAYAFDKTAESEVERSREALDRSKQNLRTQESLLKSLDLNLQKIQVDTRELDQKISGARHIFWHNVYQQMEPKIREVVMPLLDEAYAARQLAGTAHWDGMVRDILKYIPDYEKDERNQKTLKRKYFTENK